MSFSIVTTTFNAAATLQHCLSSLAAQTISFEHVLVDGGSTDGTIEIIEKNRLPGSQFISEPDDGLYDGLNKGIRMATGEVVGILHADDFYAATNVLQRVSEVFQNPSVDACYGDLTYVSERRVARGAWRDNSTTEILNSEFGVVRYWRSGAYAPRKFYWGWMPPHPTFFVRRTVYEKYGLFNLDLRTAADYELMLRFLLKQQIACCYIPETLVHMRVGGVSNASFGNRLRANRMDRKAWEVNRLKPYPWTLWMKPIRKIPQFFSHKKL